LDAFTYLKQIENIADSDYQSPPPSLLRTEPDLSAGTQLTHYIAESWESDIQGCPEMKLQNNPYYAFVTREEYKFT